MKSSSVFCFTLAENFWTSFILFSARVLIDVLRYSGMLLLVRVFPISLPRVLPKSAVKLLHGVTSRESTGPVCVA